MVSIMKQYTVVYKDNDYDEEPKIYEYLGPYQLWVKICQIEHYFDFQYTEDIFFVEYDGYIWDCTDIIRLRQIKQLLIKELKV